MKHRHYIQRPMTIVPGWNGVRQPYIVTDGPKVAREWQKRAFFKFLGKHHMAVYGPPSTGKNVFICMFSSEILRTLPDFKVIITAPQKMITKDMKQQCFILPSTGEIIYWAPKYLNDTKFNKDTNLKLAEDFLNAPRIKGGISDGAIVMTHATLVNIFKHLKHLLHNVLIVVDEEHHIKYAENNGMVETNYLGDVVKYALEQEDIHLLLTTATPFRGDRYSSVPPNKLTELFTEYEHPYDDAWADFAPLEHFSVDFVLYKGKSYRNALTELFENGVEPSIIYIPNVGSRFSVGSKQEDVMECYRAIAGRTKPTINYDDGVYTYVRKSDKWICCIDLVDETNREAKIQAISDDHDNLDPKKRKIDVIIALGMMKEGANHRWLKNEYIIGARNSLREFVQMNGRLFRSAEGKTICKTYYLLPHSANVQDVEYEENFNDYLKGTISSLLLIKVYAVRLIATPIDEQEEDLNGNKRQKRVCYIDIELPDIDKQEALLEASRDAIITASEEFDDKIDMKNGRINHEQREILANSLDDVLKEFGINNHKEEVKEEILRWFAVQNRIAMLDITGMNVKDIDIELVKDVHPCQWAIEYGSDVLGTNTFKAYREAVERSRVIWMEQFEEWKKYNQNKNEE